ncbi:MAG: Ig-like domain-containing protein [Clostridiales bacterium]|nr:Ig-like domain-containing protein [Clostridiales bacterium]
MKKYIKTFALTVVFLLVCLFAASCGAPPPEPEPEGPVFALDRSTAALIAKGEPVTLTLTMDAAIQEEPEWTSSNFDVARVTPLESFDAADGQKTVTARIQGMQEGAAVVTVTAGENSAVCNVSVAPEDSLSVVKAHIELLAGRRERIAVITALTPVKYESSDVSVATVSADGWVNGVSGGDAIITVTAGGKSVIVTVRVTDAELSLAEKRLVLFTGEERRLNVVCNGTPQWSSDKASVAAVTQDGLVRAVKEGTAVISAAYGIAEETCEVVVRDVKYEISLNRESAELTAGETLRLTATVRQYTADSPHGSEAEGAELIVWSVTDGAEIATVADGLVRAAGVHGAAVVRAALVSDAEIWAECVVTVPDPRADWIGVGTKEELYAALGNSANSEAKIYLKQDIDCDGDARGRFMETFGGVLDGNGFEIRNLKIDRFFTTVGAAALIENLSIVVTDTGGNEYGTFAHVFEGEMKNCRLDITFFNATANHKSAIALVAGSSRLSNLIILLRGTTGPNAHVLFGQGGGRKTAVFYHNYTSVSFQSDGATSKTEVELKRIETFTGWDDTVWSITAGEIPTLISAAHPQAKQFIRLVSLIPAIASLTPGAEHRASVTDARAYYEGNLTDGERALKSVENALETLEAAERKLIDIDEEGETFTDLLAMFDPEELELSDRSAVAAARAAYGQLSGNAKMLPSVIAAEAKLTALEEKIAQFEAEQRLQEEIAAFVACVSFNDPITLGDQTAIELALAAYEDLSAEAKESDAVIGAKLALDAAKDALDALLAASAGADAQAFVSLVDEIGSPVTIADAEAVTAARNAYENLSGFAKNQPGVPAALARLVTAEADLATLLAEQEAERVKDGFLAAITFAADALTAADRPDVAAARDYYEQYVADNALAVGMQAVADALDELAAAEQLIADSDAHTAEFVRLVGQIPASVTYTNAAAFLTALERAEGYFTTHIKDDVLAAGHQTAQATMTARRNAYETYIQLPPVDFSMFHTTGGLMDGLVYDPVSIGRGILGGGQLVGKVTAKFGGNQTEARARCKIVMVVKRSNGTGLFTMDFPWGGSISDDQIKAAYQNAGQTRQTGDKMYFKIVGLQGGNVIDSVEFGPLIFPG